MNTILSLASLSLGFSALFAGIEPNGRKFSTSVMNFYSFDKDVKIVDDVAATGMLGILQGIGAGEQGAK